MLKPNYASPGLSCEQEFITFTSLVFLNYDTRFSERAQKYESPFFKHGVGG